MGPYTIIGVQWGESSWSFSMHCRGILDTHVKEFDENNALHTFCFDANEAYAFPLQRIII